MGQPPSPQPQENREEATAGDDDEAGGEEAAGGDEAGNEEVESDPEASRVSPTPKDASGNKRRKTGEHTIVPALTAG